MRHAESASNAAHRALRLAGLIVVLAGLLGMHGLSGLSIGHGSTESSMPTSVAATPVAQPSGDAFDLGAATSTAASHAGLLIGHQAETLIEGEAGLGHSAMAMGAMCLFILGAALLVILWLLQRARVLPVAWSLTRDIPVVAPQGRDPDPPCLIELSINRC